MQKALNGKDLNCLINNAGVAKKLKFGDINEKDMMETYRQNVIGPWKMTKVNPIEFGDMFFSDGSCDWFCNQILHDFTKSDSCFFQAFLPLLEKSASQLKERDVKQSSVVNISAIMASLELSKSLPYFYYDYQCSKVGNDLRQILDPKCCILGGTEYVNGVHGQRSR